MLTQLVAAVVFGLGLGFGRRSIVHGRFGSHAVFRLLGGKLFSVRAGGVGRLALGLRAENEVILESQVILFQLGMDVIGAYLLFVVAGVLHNEEAAGAGHQNGDDRNDKRNDLQNA